MLRLFLAALVVLLCPILAIPEITIKFVQPINQMIPAGGSFRAIVNAASNTLNITMSLIALNGGFSYSQPATLLQTKSAAAFYYYAEFSLPVNASGGFQLTAVADTDPPSIGTLSLTAFQNQIPAFCLPPPIARCSSRCRYYKDSIDDIYSFDYGNIEVEAN